MKRKLQLLLTLFVILSCTTFACAADNTAGRAFNGGDRPGMLETYDELVVSEMRPMRDFGLVEVNDKDVYNSVSKTSDRVLFVASMAMPSTWAAKTGKALSIAHKATSLASSAISKTKQLTLKQLNRFRGMPKGGAVKGATQLEFGFIDTLASPSASGNAFQFYKQLAQTLDVSTAPNAAVVYSGKGMRSAAEAFAGVNRKTTLEMTSGGRWLDNQGLFNPGSPLTSDEALEVWATLSQRFARGASGNVTGFLNNPRATSIFNSVEYPALLENPSVSNVLTGGR